MNRLNEKKKKKTVHPCSTVSDCYFDELKILNFRRGPPRPHLKPPRCSVPMNITEKTASSEGIANASSLGEQVALNPDIENRQIDEVYQFGCFFSFQQKTAFHNFFLKYTMVKLRYFIEIYLVNS